MTKNTIAAIFTSRACGFRPLIIRTAAALTVLALVLALVRVMPVKEGMSWAVTQMASAHSHDVPAVPEVSLSVNRGYLVEANEEGNLTFNSAANSSSYYVKFTVTASTALATSTDVYFNLVTNESEEFDFTATASDVILSVDENQPATSSKSYRVRIPASETSAVFWMLASHDRVIEAYPEETIGVRLATSTDGLYRLSQDNRPVSVTITEGVCDRTLEVCEALVDLSGGGDCDGVSLQDIENTTSAIVEISTSTRSSLKSRDFDNLPDLQRIHLKNNNIAELPPGLFSGLTKLNDLDFTRRGGKSAFPIQATLEPGATTTEGGQRFRIQVPTGAPFDMRVTLSVSAARNGDTGQYIMVLAGDSTHASTTTFTVPAGSTESADIRVLTSHNPPAGNQASVSIQSVSFVDSEQSNSEISDDKHEGLIEDWTTSDSLPVNAGHEEGVLTPPLPRLTLDTAFLGRSQGFIGTATTTEGSTLHLIVKSSAFVATSSEPLAGNIQFVAPEATTTPALEWWTDIRPSGSGTSTDPGTSTLPFSIPSGDNKASVSLDIRDNDVVDHWSEVARFVIATSTDYTVGDPHRVEIEVFEGICDRSPGVQVAIATSTFPSLPDGDCDHHSLHTRRGDLEGIPELTIKNDQYMKTGDLLYLTGLTGLDFSKSTSIQGVEGRPGHFPDRYFHEVKKLNKLLLPSTSTIPFHFDVHMDFDRQDSSGICYFDYDSRTAMPYHHTLHFGYQTTDGRWYGPRAVDHEAGEIHFDDWVSIKPKDGHPATTTLAASLTFASGFQREGNFRRDGLTDPCREEHDHEGHEDVTGSQSTTTALARVEPQVSIKGVRGDSSGTSTGPASYRALQLVLSQPAASPLEVMYFVTAPPLPWDQYDYLVAISTITIAEGATTTPIAFNLDLLGATWVIHPEEVTYHLSIPTSDSGYALSPNCREATMDGDEVTNFCGVTSLSTGSAPTNSNSGDSDTSNDLQGDAIRMTPTGSKGDSS